MRIEPLKEDQAPSAILELVDGPRDMRFAITARALVRQRGREERGQGSGISEVLAAHVRKVTRFREGREEDLEREVRRLEKMGRGEGGGRGRESRGGMRKRMMLLRGHRKAMI